MVFILTPPSELTQKPGEWVGLVFSHRSSGWFVDCVHCKDVPTQVNTTLVTYGLCSVAPPSCILLTVVLKPVTTCSICEEKHNRLKDMFAHDCVCALVRVTVRTCFGL